MKKGIIVASFGTTYKKTRKLSIESIENMIKTKYKNHLVLRAFTSNIVRKRLKTRDGLYIFDVKEAIEKMKEETKEIYIQPLHFIAGVEYEKILTAVRNALSEDDSLNIKVGKPLLFSERDYKDVVDALDLEDLEGEGNVFMGHGSYHKSDFSYKKINDEIKEKGFNNTFIATVEGAITLENIIPELKIKNIKTVNLKPFMLVAGDHANNDMASDDEDSWKSILEKEGFKVNIEMKSLGENKDIRQIFLKHLEKVM
ncbi:MAG: sirohydrochlorin cobaltochelatase [Tissierella sp.]|uniref:sirohydrochlorin cobaltochelatase n=1 Tax=Tissierella sp. TaxID=41274 RepID=UPI003F955978